MPTKALIFFNNNIRKFKLLRSKLEKFLVKRILIVFVILAMVDLVFLDHKWLILLGLILGGAFGILKFSSTSSVYARLFGIEEKRTIVRRSVLVYIINQLATIALLVVSATVNLYLFIGTIAGILLVPLVLFINALTEGFGITHNNFE